MTAASKEGETGSLLARVPEWAILFAFCLVFSLQVVLAASRNSPTFDEAANLASGYMELTVGDYWLFPRDLPFVKWLAALPLLLVNVRVPSPSNMGEDPWDFGAIFVYDLNGGDRLLLLGKLAVLPLALLLGGLVFRWTRELYGKGAALFALFLFSFEPNLLAHAGLVTTDMAVACLMFGTVYGLYRVTQGGLTLAGLLLPGLALGLGLLTKFTLHPLVLTLVLLTLAASLAPSPLTLRLPGLPPGELTGRARKLFGFLLLLLAWSVLAYAVIWAVYRFRYEAVSLAGLAAPRGWDAVMPRQPWLQALARLAQEAKLLPEAYLYGFLESIRDSGRYPAFLMGEIRLGGWWYYFLVTFLLKTPLALLFLVGLALWVGRKHSRLAPPRHAFLLVPVLVYFILISASGYNVGHRHLLPIYPFLFVGVGGLVPWAWQSARGGRWVQGTLGVLAAWYLAAALWIAPHYLAYFNEVTGGPAQGYKYLVDSNLDWGQDLKGLMRYMDAQQIPRVWLSYFGAASPDSYGIRYNYLPSYFILHPRREAVPTPFVAISATNLQGVYFEALGLDRDLFKPFRDRQPIAKIGYTIFVYRLN